MTYILIAGLMLFVIFVARLASLEKKCPMCGSQMEATQYNTHPYKCPSCGYYE
jgi:tRNA(Ile2) C34 agmatinyltransferase TiaS